MADLNPNDIVPLRVLYEIPGMRDVAVRRDVAYRETGSPAHTMDIYYPPGGERMPPVVVLVTGYSGSMQPRLLDCTYKELGWTISTAQLLAASGLAAVAYTNDEAVADAHALLDHLVTNAEALGIDPTRIGLWSCSGNCPMALSLLMRQAPVVVRSAVFLCGFLLDLDAGTEVADTAAQVHFANACAGRSIEDMRKDVPMFVVRAGRDQFAGLNDSMDRFLAKAVTANLPITFANHAEGPHGFDLFDDSVTTRTIVGQALGFTRDHLRA